MSESDPIPPPAESRPIAPEILKSALKAFKKRMKITRLDNESGTMGGPLSKGKTSAIMAITPPSQFPREVWEELVKQGKLRYEGHGTYRLGEQA